MHISARAMNWPSMNHKLKNAKFTLVIFCPKHYWHYFTFQMKTLSKELARITLTFVLKKSANETHHSIHPFLLIDSILPINQRLFQERCLGMLRIEKMQLPSMKLTTCPVFRLRVASEVVFYRTAAARIC